jgi:hypothetical protein
MPVLKTVTLGCKVNQYETEYVRQGLLRAGFREPEGDEPADLCVVNTCTVTLESDYQSRKIIRALARENPRAEIVVMGCYATRAAEELSRLPGVVEVVTDKRQLPQLLARFGLADAPSGISSFGRLHRAYVKVQDGCRMQCSYCVIPRVRPAPWSRPVAEVLEEVRRLANHGHLEIVLTGIHLGHYGLDLPERQPGGRRIDLADRRDGGPPRAGLPTPPHPPAKWLGGSARPDAPPRRDGAAGGAVRTGSPGAGPPGTDDRRHSRLPRRDGGRVPGHVSGGWWNWVLQAPRLQVQCPRRDPGGSDARPGPVSRQAAQGRGAG